MKYRLWILAAVFSVSACSGGASSSLGLAAGTSVPNSAVPPLSVTAVEANTSSVKLDISPVAGAADYRVYDASNPARVKYAGLVQSASKNGTLVPATQIEWDGLTPGRPAILVVEAVDKLGPYPAGNLPAFNPPLPAGCLAAGAPPHGGTPGSNEGSTGSGIAIAGRGCPADTPNAIARSNAITVAATGTAALPSSSAASNVFFDPFSAAEASTLVRIVAPDVQTGSETFTLGRPPTSWTVLVDNADLRDTSLALGDGTFKDVLFDGGTSGSNAPPHAARSSLALVPNANADLSGGRILHATVEIDSHFSAKRGFGFALAPPTDPFSSLYTDGAVNRSNTGLFVQVFGGNEGGVTVDEFAGTRTRVLGPGGSAGRGGALQGPDLGLADRSRWDLFVSQTHVALYQNGARVAETDLPSALPFNSAKLYFVHYLNRSASDAATLRASAPYEDYWLQYTPYSDERTWSNAGFEVLPAGTAWAGLAGSIKLPAKQPL
jgi:hypothetical protein